MRLRPAAPLTLAAAALFAACADDQTARPTGPDGAAAQASAPASLSVQVNTAAAPAVASLVIEVTAADLATPLAFTLPVANGSASGTVRVAPGTARTFAVRAFDAAGHVTHEGARTIDVRPGANAALNVPLRAAAGQVPISVTLGGVRVALGRTALSLRPGDTATVTVAVTEADGTPVANPAVTWVSTHPGKLSVSDAGLVTARDTGEARVVAVYDGAAASAAVTVGAGEWVQVSAGGEQSCGLTRGGRIYCWGSNHAGQLGNAQIPATGSLAPVEIGGGRTYRQLTVSGLVGCALTTAGAAYCWGWNEAGQLGIGTTASVLEPRPVSGGHAWATISAGNVNVCGVTTAGRAYCWGSGATGALGDSTLNSRYVPMPVAGGHTFAQIDAGGRHTCALKADGEAWCWGKDHFGQLGVNSAQQDDFAGPVTTYPVRVAGGLRFRQISADGNNTCGVTLAGKAYCWGQASQTGTDAGDHTHRRVPTAVAPHLTFAVVRPSTFESCGLTTDGALYCWGYYRPVATETAGAGGYVPDRVPTPFRVADLQEAPFNHLCVTATTGVAYCGGVNTGGKVGNGSTENTAALVKAQDPR